MWLYNTINYQYIYISIYMNIDKIFIISLPEANERRKQLKQYLPIDNNIFEFYYPIRDNDNPARGCFNSHQNIIKISKNRKYNTIIILEDDAVPLHSWNNITIFINNFFKSPPKDWKYLLLGCLPIRMNKINDNLYESKCSFDGHAYMVNMDKVDIIEWDIDQTIDAQLFCNGVKQNNLYIDIFSTLSSEYNKGIYAIYPMLFKQVTDHSYIDDFDLSQKYFFDFWGYDGSIIVSSYSNTVLLGLFIIFNIISLVLIYINNYKDIYMYIYILLVFIISIILFIDYINYS